MQDQMTHFPFQNALWVRLKIIKSYEMSKTTSPNLTGWERLGWNEINEDPHKWSTKHSIHVHVTNGVRQGPILIPEIAILNMEHCGASTNPRWVTVSLDTSKNFHKEISIKKTRLLIQSHTCYHGRHKFVSFNQYLEYRQQSDNIMSNYMKCHQISRVLLC